jgi:hypothetical protein
MILSPVPIGPWGQPSYSSCRIGRSYLLGSYADPNSSMVGSKCTGELPLRLTPTMWMQLEPLEHCSSADLNLLKNFRLRRPILCGLAKCFGLACVSMWHTQRSKIRLIWIKTSLEPKRGIMPCSPTNIIASSLHLIWDLTLTNLQWNLLPFIVRSLASMAWRWRPAITTTR